MASKPKKVEAEDIDDEEEGAEAAAPSKGWLSRKMIMIAGGVALVLIGGGAGYFMLSGPKEARPVVVQAKPAVFLGLHLLRLRCHPSIPLCVCANRAKPQKPALRVPLLPLVVTLGSEWLTDCCHAAGGRKDLPGAWFRRTEFAGPAVRAFL